ncbi:MAG TPA: hypothetical protein DDW87_08630 [Firmicutes bacterium]|nr:hypothetical protein [Bacillota bacterium]
MSRLWLAVLLSNVLLHDLPGFRGVIWNVLKKRVRADQSPKYEDEGGKRDADSMKLKPPAMQEEGNPLFYWTAN